MAGDSPPAALAITCSFHRAMWLSERRSVRSASTAIVRDAWAWCSALLCVGHDRPIAGLAYWTAQPMAKGIGFDRHGARGSWVGWPARPRRVFDVVISTEVVRKLMREHIVVKA